MNFDYVDGLLVELNYIQKKNGSTMPEEVLSKTKNSFHEILN